MKKSLSFIFLYLFNIIGFSSSIPQNLEFQRAYFNYDDLEVSGLTLLNNKLLLVGDKLSNHFIYEVHLKGKRFIYKPYIDLSKLAGHDNYLKQAMKKEHYSPLDLEGLAYCGDTFYLINEQQRHLLEINKQSLKQMNLDFPSLFKRFGYNLSKISRNAGFEGLTIDCEKQIAYIAQERSPRGIINVDLKTQTPITLFQTWHRLSGLSADYSALFFENGFLYALERNSHLITKIDPKNQKIIAQFSFAKMGEINTHDLYDTGEPYGIAEGLTMNKDQIFIGLDNNKKPLSQGASKRFKIKGNISSILVFKRPQGF